MRLPLVLVTIVLLAAGCSGDDGGSPGPDDLADDLEIAATVTVTEYAFDADEVTVSVGETVEWQNDGDVVHAVEAEDTLFSSGELHPGESSAFTFDTPGRHEYRCTIHPQQMRGVIEVENGE